MVAASMLLGCAQPGPGEGWTTLIDGRNIDAFERVGDAAPSRSPRAGRISSWC
jgi:hypothetical protein